MMAMSCQTATIDQPVSALRIEESVRPALDPRTWRLLGGPILPLMLSLASPNIPIMIAEPAAGLTELWLRRTG
jgi:hypothetical protein